MVQGPRRSGLRQYAHGAMRPASACRLRQHAHGGGKDQRKADHVLGRRPFAEHQHRAGDADDRRRERTERGCCGRQALDNGEPQDISETGPDQTIVDHRQNRFERHSRRHRHSLKYQQPCTEDERAERDLPCGDGKQVTRDARPFHVDRAGGPTERAAERKQQPDRRRRRRHRIDEHGQSADAQHQPETRSDAQALAEDQPGHQARPDRHGIIDDHHPRGGRGEQGKRAEQPETDDVEHGGRDDMQPCYAAWNGGAAALQPDQCKQGQRAERESQDAKRPYADLGQCDRHDRPAQAPDQSQEHKQRLGFGDFVQSVLAGPRTTFKRLRWMARARRAKCGTLARPCGPPTSEAGALHKHTRTRSKTSVGS